MCRPIDDEDLPAVADLLTRGFPVRSRDYWAQGLERLRTRALPEDCLRYGLILDCGGPVGVILQLYCETSEGQLRCNLSSWYVEPAFRSYTGSLVLAALRRRDVTYTNISAAPHTAASVEAVGFNPYADQQMLALLAFGRRQRGVVVRSIGSADRARAPHGDLLRDHATLGCVTLVVEANGTEYPFVFIPFHINYGWLRVRTFQLVFCDSDKDMFRFAGPIGRFMLFKFGILAIIMDTRGRIPGVLGLYRSLPVRRYFRNGTPPKLNDFSYSERVFFGA